MSTDRIKKAMMKLDSFVNDITDMLEEENLTDDRRYELMTIKEICYTILAKFINELHRELGEEDDFLNDIDVYDPDSLDIEPFPEFDLFDDTEDLLETDIQNF